MSDDDLPADEPVVRRPRASELRRLAAIEDSGIVLFTEALGEEAVGDALRSPAPSGQQREDAPGTLLVVGRPPVGFVHVLHLDGFAHLEQVSVLPEEMRKGLGSALVRAAARDAEADGFTQLSLCTYRDLPWNAPFYEALGFRVVEDLLPFQQRLRAHEMSLGLDESGPRVVMSLDLTPEQPRPPGITEEPEDVDPFALEPVEPVTPVEPVEPVEPGGPGEPLPAPTRPTDGPADVTDE